MESLMKINDPILLALIATGFTWFMTALGAAMVFFFKEINKRVLNMMLGFAAGIMVAASFWSLLAPAIEMAEKSSLPAWLSPSRCRSRTTTTTRSRAPAGTARVLKSWGRTC